MDSQHLNLRISADTMDELRDEGRRTGRTVSEVTRAALTLYLNRAAGYHVHDLRREAATTARRAEKAEPVLCGDV